MNLSAFKAYDIRGNYPTEINEQLAYLVGRAVVEYFSAKVIVVGRDMRNSSPSLMAELIRGINDGGADVINIGMCTTPMLNFAVANYNYDGGIMISASHNPGGDNAFKVINQDVIQLDELSGLNELKSLIESGFGPAENVGTSTDKNVLDDYVAHITTLIGDLPPLKIVADYGNGVGAISAVPIFSKLKLDIDGLFAEPDGNFPNHQANPHDLANFNSLISKVKEESADFGIFFDGDADRANFVDDRGRIVSIDILTLLLAQQELKTKSSGNVYYDLRFSKAVPTAIRAAGGNPIMMRVGNPFYKRVLRDQGGVLGSEFAGHIMFPDNYNIDDGLFAALKTIKLVGGSGKKLSELLDEATVFCASPEESMEAKSPSTVFDRLYDAFPDAKRVDLDGAYLDFVDDGFISVRQSQSERRLFRIRVEARTEATLKDRFNKVKAIVSEG